MHPINELYDPHEPTPPNLLESFTPPDRRPTKPFWGLTLPIYIIFQILAFTGLSIGFGVQLHKKGWNALTWELLSALILISIRPLPYAYALLRARFQFWGKVARDSAKREENVVLDIGCATGAVMLEIARTNTQATVVGVDHFVFFGNVPNSPRRLYLNTLALNLSTPRIVAHQVPSYLSLPFADESFDLITSHSGISMSGWSNKDALNALRECDRLLRVGGRLVVFESDPANTSKYKKFLEKELGWTEVSRRVLWNCWFELSPSAYLEAFKPAQRSEESV